MFFILIMAYSSLQSLSPLRETKNLIEGFLVVVKALELVKNKEMKRLMIKL